jgi:DNA polymerase elongation subunit (family B)
MSKFSIICPESSTVEVDGKIYPCVVLIGRDEHLNRVKLRQKCFPYFYLTEKDYRIVSKSRVFQDWHVHEVKDTKIRDINGNLLKKIFVSDCGRIGESVEGINKLARVQARVRKEMNHRVYTYESDLSKNDMLPLRFLIDNGIKSGCNVENGKVVSPCDFQVPLRIWLIDFEAYVFKEYTTGLSPKDPLYMVTIWDSYENKLYTFYTNNPKWNVEKQCSQFMIPFTKFEHEIRKFDTEAQMLDALVDLVIEKEPDLFSAWNLNRYDYPKWKQRMDLLKSNCLHKFSDISPLKCVVHSRTLRVKGRIGFDEMVAYKQFTDQEMDEYSLAYVSEYEELGYKKIPFVGTSGHCWDVAPEIAFKRNVYDVLIIKALEDKYDLIDCYDDLRIEFGALFQNTFVRHMNIDSALMRMVNGKIALRTVSGESPPEEKLLGAVVVAPEPDEYYNVFQFDFGREYPSLIRGLNISPETYSDREIQNSYYVVYNWVTEEGGKKHFEAWFDKSKTGLLPHLISFFFNKRDEYDKELKKAIADGKSEGEIRRWERRQYNMKKTTNAIYGVMDYPRFRLHNPACTQATAIMGRISIEEEKRFLQEIGYELLYGDTDSFFVIAHGKTKEELLKEGKALQKRLNEHLTEFLVAKYGVTKAPAELGFKKIYSKIMFIAKKNYAGKSIWDEKKGWKEELDIKGITSVRSDNSMLEKTTVKEVVKLVLNDASKEIIDNFTNSIFSQFDAHKYGYYEMAYPAQLKKRMWVENGNWRVDQDKTLSAHYKSAIYSNLYLNTDFSSGDKPRRLPILLPKKKKLKVSSNQQSLFKELVIPDPFPLEFMVNDKIRKLSDISIVADMRIPQWFVEHIDYDRIKKRLEGKINKILDIHFKVVKD